MKRGEVERMVGAVRRAQELLGGSTAAAEALAPALNVSFFLLDGHGYNFEDYLAAFRNSAPPSMGVFPSQDAFHSWLKNHSVPPPAGTVQIAGARYSLGYGRLNGQPLLLRLLPKEELRRPGDAREHQRLWHALEQARSVLASSPEDEEGLDAAALALHFVHEAGCTREFVHFLAHLDEPLPPLCSFATWEDADAWLRHHPRPPDGACVWVGKEEFMVGYHREREQRVLVRPPPVNAPGEDREP